MLGVVYMQNYRHSNNWWLLYLNIEKTELNNVGPRVAKYIGPTLARAESDYSLQPTQGVKNALNQKPISLS